MSDIKTSSDLVPAARQDGDALVLALRGEIDLNNSPELRTELFDLLARQSPRRLILNLKQVPYMDSSAIAVMVEMLKKVKETGGKVLLTDLQPRVKSLLQIARLGSIFTICQDEAEALSKKGQ